MSDQMGPSTMDFPEKSDRNTEKLYAWDEVRQMLDKQIKRRAEYVTAVIEAMVERFGEEAYDVASQAIYQIGYRKGKARSEYVREQGEEPSLQNLAELIAHEMSRLYLGTTTEVGSDELVVRETYCPLPAYWKSAGLSDSQIVRYCRIFDQVDKGMIEGYNDQFEPKLGGAEQLAAQGYCQMVVLKKEST
jgi:ribonucleotide reductase alpha subunit